MVADITGEIQTYQNMPYNLEVEDNIRLFLENLDPYEGRSSKEMGDYLFELSSKIEPRNSKKPAVFVSSEKFFCVYKYYTSLFNIFFQE